MQAISGVAGASTLRLKSCVLRHSPKVVKLFFIGSCCSQVTYAVNGWEQCDQIGRFIAGHTGWEPYNRVHSDEMNLLKYTNECKFG